MQSIGSSPDLHICYLDCLCANEWFKINSNTNVRIIYSVIFHNAIKIEKHYLFSNLVVIFFKGTITLLSSFILIYILFKAVAGPFKYLTSLYKSVSIIFLRSVNFSHSIISFFIIQLLSILRLGCPVQPNIVEFKLLKIRINLS